MSYFIEWDNPSYTQRNNMLQDKPDDRHNV